MRPTVCKVLTVNFYRQRDLIYAEKFRITCTLLHSLSRAPIKTNRIFCLVRLLAEMATVVGACLSCLFNFTTHLHVLFCIFIISRNQLAKELFSILEVFCGILYHQFLKNACLKII